MIGLPDRKNRPPAAHRDHNPKPTGINCRGITRSVPNSPQAGMPKYLSSNGMHEVSFEYRQPEKSLSTKKARITTPNPQGPGDRHPRLRPAAQSLDKTIAYQGGAAAGELPLPPACYPLRGLPPCPAAGAIRTLDATGHPKVRERSAARAGGAARAVVLHSKTACHTVILRGRGRMPPLRQTLGPAALKCSAGRL